jgi:transposase InsO family protein
LRPFTRRPLRSPAAASSRTPLEAGARGRLCQCRGFTDDLHEAGWRVNEKTVAKIMREQGLRARAKKRRKHTTRPGKSRWRAPDLIGRNFPAARLNRKWYGDGSEIVTDEGKLHLACWTWPRAASSASQWTNITTRSWPTPRWRWPLPAAVGRM